MLFWASIAIFIISIAHLTLIVHLASIDKTIKASAQARVTLAAFQVSPNWEANHMFLIFCLMSWFTLGSYLDLEV
jgi:hypothetical protein